MHVFSRNEDPIDTAVESVLPFLHGMYTDSYLCSEMCGAASALTSFVCIERFSKLSDHPMIYI